MSKEKKNILKKVFFVLFFLLVMGLTFYAVFSGTDPKLVFEEISTISPVFIILMLLSTLAYIATESGKIWLLMDGKRKIKNYLRCVTYALIEFFYGGITPSASGGQPIQLLYMKKDGYSFTKGCAAMSFDAATNKFVLSITGLGMVIFWQDTLQSIFGAYLFWFYLGWLILVCWTIILTAFIFNPNICQRAVLWMVGLPVKLHIIKDRSKVDHTIVYFFDAYRGIITMLRENLGKALITVCLSFLQRFFLLLVTYWVYQGLGLTGSSFAYIILVQMAVTISSDMIPLPGAQGISEYIYHKVFEGVFGATYLTTSMCASRAVNFYFILFLGLLVVILRNFRFKKNHTSLEEDPENLID